MMNNKLILLAVLAIVFSTQACKDDEMVGNPTPTLSRLSVTDVSKFEGDEETTTFSFRIRLDQAADEEVRVDYTTQTFTAAVNEDFIATAGTATFPVGETQFSFDVQVLTDTLKEQDEQFKIVISNPVGAAIASDEGLGTIRNDDTFQVIPDDGYSTPEEYAGWNKVWADEFNGPTLDLNSWKYEVGNSGWGNNELQYYREGDSNAFINDGKLVIEARQESFGGADYTSARLITSELKEFQFGRIDIRAKLPEGQGIWPALWMLGSNFWTQGWPSCGEIDIMELVGHEPGKVHTTLHWGPQGFPSQNKSYEETLPGGAKFSEEFHVFSLIWEEDIVRSYLDDELYGTWTPADMNGQNYPFNQPFFFIFNIAVGGNWPGSPDVSTVFPQQMVVDYVRVFQQ